MGRWHRIDDRLSLRVGAYHVPLAPFRFAVAMVAARAAHREHTSLQAYVDTGVVFALVADPRLLNDDDRNAPFAVKTSEI